MKLIVAGMRTFSDYNTVKLEIDRFIDKKNIDKSKLEIVSGNCNGADRLGERYGRENNIPIRTFPAQWSKYGKSAGPMRNKAMAEYAKDDGYLIVFWDGKSRGTQSMLYEASNAGLPYKIVFVNEGKEFDSE